MASSTKNRSKSKSPRRKPRRGKRPEPTAEEIAQREKAQEALQQQMVRAQALSPEVSTESISAGELQRQLGEQTAKVIVLQNRLTYANGIIEELETEIASLRADAAGKGGKDGETEG